MSRFLPKEEFYSAERAIQLLPFRFERASKGYLVSNMVGDFIRLSPAEFQCLTAGDVAPGDGLYEKAFAAHLVAREGQTGQLQLLGARLRSRMAFLRQPSTLHLFVVTLRCEHSCPYCQVSRQSTDKSRFDMSEHTAERALSIALESPSSHIKIEFQGGEPLLNLPLIAKIVANAKLAAPKMAKQIEFVIASNFALLTDEILDYCKSNEIMLSTSLDGPAYLHDRNRPRPGGNSHDLAVKGIRAAQRVLGPDRVSALMTTTEASLDRVEQIIDEYVSLGLDGIFLRPLSPYGFAVKTKQIQKYDTKRWLDFYGKGIKYILDINRSGKSFFEFYTLLLLRRMFSDRPIGYVDLRSPAGVGLGALVYNYDGKVFASDEGRMLSEMGDNTFALGHVDSADYRSLVMSQKLIDFVGSTLSQCAPECLNCVYEKSLRG